MRAAGFEPARPSLGGGLSANNIQSRRVCQFHHARIVSKLDQFSDADDNYRVTGTAL